jgi:hypothetical protein
MEFSGLKLGQVFYCIEHEICKRERKLYVRSVRNEAINLSTKEIGHFRDDNSVQLVMNKKKHRHRRH